MPLVHLTRFYYLTVQKVLLKLHEQFFSFWNIEVGELMADLLIELNNKGEEFKSKFDIDVIIIALNKKLSKLPKVLEWLGRKLIDSIPIMSIVNAFDPKDLDESNKEKLSNSIADKINELELDAINSFVPFWVKFFIPLNIIILLYYIYM